MNLKKIFVSLSSLLLLCSCSGEGNSLPSNDLTSGDTSSLVNSEGEQTTVPTSVPTSEPSQFENNPWGKELAEAIYETVQTVIPYQEGTVAKYEQSIDDYGDPLISIYLTYDSEDAANKAFNDYANACAAVGYVVEIQTLKYIDYETLSYFLYDVAFADLVIGDHLGVEIQTTVSTYEGKDALGIFAYNYVHCEKNEYPSVAVDKLFGEYSGIPEVIGEGYEYSFMFFIDQEGNQGLEIVVTGCTYEIEEEYFNLFAEKTTYYQIKCDTLDEDYEEQVSEYVEFEDQFYYMGWLGDEIAVVYDYDLSNQAFVIDLFLLPTEAE